VPISAFVVLCAFIFWYGFQQMNNIQQTLGVTNTVSNINMLTHSLQVERNSTLNHINSNYLDYRDNLITHRSNTNKALINYQNNMSLLSPQLINEDMHLYINDSKELLVLLNEQRETIDGQLSSIEKTQKYYNNTIETLLNIYNAMVLLDIDGNLTRNITAISVMNNLKEVAEQEHDLVINLLDKKPKSNNAYQQLSMLIGKQQGLLVSFEKILSKQQQKMWSDLTNSEIFINVKKLETEVLSNNSTKYLSRINRQQLQNIMSSKISLLNLFIEQLIVDIEVNINNKVKAFEMLAVKASVVLLFILLTIMLISWLLTQSIIYPIRTITYAITRLSQGHRGIRFTKNIYHDELGKMIDGYEYSRRKLLQADILSTVGTMKQSVHLSQIESEKIIYQELASIDPLTGIINRRKFNELAERELIRVKRYNHNLSLIMIDIDHFTKMNISYGNSSADRVLQEFCQVCNTMIRNIDIFSRIGGEEFVILLPETKLQQAHVIAERICAAAASHSVIIDETKIKFTVSIGVTAWDETIGVMSSLIDKADKALYEAKINGRNRVVIK
jgi:diguanylate cyclase (GGDEF)-like protein